MAALILRQDLLDPQARQVEEIAEGVFVFLRSQPAIERATPLRDLRGIGLVELGVQQREKRRRLFSRGRLIGLRRHLARGDPVVHPLPESEVLRIVERERERVEIEAAFLR